ncbi:hypothetical protein BDW74DRAFT_165444 [Aspergillus multicolor]|uniref:FAD-binding oxidoreductase n=1 Tax=Aspergillus multicolor TaxID=41759 RepID=UPI003CCCB489
MHLQQLTRRDVSSSCACEQLASTYPPNLILPGSQHYTAQATDAYWDVRAALSPACIFLPATANEVSTALQVINACDAHFAVRGGGHQNVPGSNNIDAGVLIALSNLNELSINNTTNTISVGPGRTWYDIYSALEPTGRIAIGGRLKTIGVPGLTLIGGFHYFNNKYGYAMDNVLSYDVVLGNGTRVVASRSQHPDLFWALKGGGGNNFGIVTKFVLKTHAVPQGKVSGTIQSFNESAVPGFLGAVVEASKVQDSSVAAGMVATVGFNVTTGVTSATLMGVQEGVTAPGAAPSRFENFTAISSFAINSVGTMRAWAESLETPMQQYRIVFAHHTIKADTNALIAIYNIWKDAVAQIADVEGLNPTFVPNYVSPGSVHAGKDNGVGNVWGLEEEALIVWQFSTSWTRASDSLRVEQWSRLLSERIHRLNKEKGLASEFVYMGDAGDWQDPFAGFPEGNVRRLKGVQEQYDSGGVFTRLSWGGFKLSVA